MEASGAGQAQAEDAAATTTDQPQEPVGNGIVVVCGLFEAGAVVELVERGPQDVRPGGASAIRGRRTVDKNGEVGFSGLTPGDLYFVSGYSDGEPLFVRCVAQDPSSGVMLLQPPEQAIPAQQGTAQTPVVDEPAAAPAEATEGEGLPAGVTSPVLGEGDAQPQRYYLHDGQAIPDDTLWRKANVREQIVPADDSRTPNDLWVFIGGDEQVALGDGWTLYEGPTEPVPAVEEAPATADDHLAAEAEALKAQQNAEAAAATAAEEAAAAKQAEEAAKAASDQVAADAAAQQHADALAAEEKAKADAQAAEEQATASAKAAEEAQAAADAAAQAAPDTAAEAPAASSTPEAGPAQATSDQTASDQTSQAADPATAADAAPATPSAAAAAASGTPIDGAAAGTDAAAAPIDQANPPAPTAGTPDASESSGTGAANGGAVEESKVAATDPSAAASSAAPGAADGSASTAAVTDGAPAAEAAPAWDQLVQQAEGAGVENAKALSDAELRQAITEKGLTPVV